MTLTLALLASSADASSHREAPGIAKDPAADITDFYAFKDPNNVGKFVMIMNVNPLEAPGGGPNFHGFDDSVWYEMKCDNEGDGIEDVTFRFDFTTTYNYPGEFLYNLGGVATPGNVNHTQTYTVRRIDDGVQTILVNGADPGTVAPANVGVMSAAQGSEYNPMGSTPGSITTDNIESRGLYRFFAGPRQEGFYVDLERTFDLLNLGGAGNTNTLLGANVHSIAIEVPVATMTKNGGIPSAAAQNQVIACWATTSRQRTRTFQANGDHTDAGPYVQISRLGNPLVNEAVIPVSLKDTFNGSQPSGDIQFLSYVTNPILPIYMDAILGVPNPVAYDDAAVPNAVVPQPARDDLVLAFLTGHPAVGNLPSGFALGGPIPGEAGKTFAAFEALRVNLTTASAFPNGRAVGDDVVDTALSAMAGLLINGATVPDGVSSAGLHYLTSFPWLGDPWAGDSHPVGYHP
jgi:hypothetical protein